MRAAPHFPKCKCVDCCAWRVEVRTEHDEREYQREQLQIIRVPRGWLAGVTSLPIFEHDLA